VPDPTPTEQDYFDWMLSDASHGDDEQPAPAIDDASDINVAEYADGETPDESHTPKKAA
jgi:hypothetical protein